MKNGVKPQTNKENVQNSSTQKNTALMVLQKADEKPKDDCTTEKVDQTKEAKIEEVKMITQSFLPSAQDRIKRAENFALVTKKFSHLQEKKDELDKFIIASDEIKEKLILENSQGQKIEVSNSVVLGKIKTLMNEVLTTLLKEAEQEVQTFEV